MDLLAFLKESKIFASVSEGDLVQVCRLAKQRQYKRGEMILSPTTVPLYFLCITGGWAKVYTESASGEEVINRMMTKHDFCGESFIFPDQAYSPPFTVQAITPVRAFLLPMAFMQQRVQACLHLSLNLLRSALQRRQDLAMEIEHLSIQSAAQRIGCFILRLADQSKLRDNSLRLPYDKFLLATQLGMRAETFSRALDRLSRSCGIRIEGQEIHIKDVSRVSHYVCMHCSLSFPCMPANHQPLAGVQLKEKMDKAEAK